MIPFAVVGSERNVIIDGKSVRGRKNRWGVVNVESEQHCEFMHLRNFLTRSVLWFALVGYCIDGMFCCNQDTPARFDRDDCSNPL